MARDSVMKAATRSVSPHGHRRGRARIVVSLDQLKEWSRPWVARPVKGRTGFGLREECGSCRHGAHGGLRRDRLRETALADATLLEKSIQTVDRVRWGYSRTFSKSLSWSRPSSGRGTG
jgi:hypothetical protein